MDNPDITMEEYIQLEAEKARRRGQKFNWETVMYGKVRYFEDIDYFIDFENEFSAIVYNDAPTPEPYAGIQTHLQHTFLLINATWKIILSKS
ncbi:hypothetical protein Tco_0863577 [Tanacetum coccineum]